LKSIRGLELSNNYIKEKGNWSLNLTFNLSFLIKAIYFINIYYSRFYTVN